MASFSFLSFSYQVEGREGVVEGLSGGGRMGREVKRDVRPRMLEV